METLELKREIVKELQREGTCNLSHLLTRFQNENTGDIMIACNELEKAGIIKLAGLQYYLPQQ